MPASIPPLKVEGFLPESEASRRTHLSRVFLWEARNNKRNPLKFIRIGRGIFYEPAELDRWILTNGRCAARSWTPKQRQVHKRRSPAPAAVSASKGK